VNAKCQVKTLPLIISVQPHLFGTPESALAHHISQHVAYDWLGRFLSNVVATAYVASLQ